VTAGADIQIVFWGGKIQFQEEYPVELLGIMLLRVNDKVVELSLPAFANDRRHFYDFRASPDENGDFHLSSINGLKYEELVSMRHKKAAESWILLEVLCVPNQPADHRTQQPAVQTGPHSGPGIIGTIVTAGHGIAEILIALSRG
jgi:hypothetical protein